MRTQVLLRIIRVIIMVVFSSLWVIPLYSALHGIMESMRVQEMNLNSENASASFCYAEVAQAFLRIGTVWLVLVLIFWTFVLTKKMWPVNTNNYKKREN